VRLKSIQKRLEKVRSQRQQGRRSRQRAEMPTISLVGYTNAGKSTLFNRLTDSEVFAADKLFATLDPTMRRLDLAEFGSVILADTVGFISHLPHKLVDAFSATLEEAASATLLLHIVDAGSDERQRNMDSVMTVLEEIGAAENPQLLVYNKIDLLDGMEPHIDRNDSGRPVAVWLSAQTGAGVDLLADAIRECLGGELVVGRFYVAPERARLRARLYELGAIQSEETLDDGGVILRLSLPVADFNRLLKAESLNPGDFPALTDIPVIAESA